MKPAVCKKLWQTKTIRVNSIVSYIKKESKSWVDISKSSTRTTTVILPAASAAFLPKVRTIFCKSCVLVSGANRKSPANIPWLEAVWTPVSSGTFFSSHFSHRLFPDKGIFVPLEACSFVPSINAVSSWQGKPDFSKL